MASNPRIDDLRKRLEKDPGSRLFAQLAEELRKAGEFEEAIALSREGLQKHPAYPSARMTLGRALFDRKDFGGARTELEAVLKGAADNILASRLLAECLEGLGDLPAAAGRYRQTLAMAPGDRQIGAKVAALEARLENASRAAATSLAAPPNAPRPLAADAPIPLVAADEAFELERPYEAPVEPLRPSDAEPLLDPEPAEAPEPIEFGLPLAFRPVLQEGPVPEATLVPDPASVTVPGLAPVVAPSEPVDLAPPGQLFEFDAPDDLPDAVTLMAPAPVFEPPAAVPPPLVEQRPAAAAAEPPRMLPQTDAELPPPWVAPPAAPPAPEIISSTLAELYFNQGFTEKAVEVYQQVLGREPGNERVRARLSELRGSETAIRAEVAAAPTAQGGDGRAARREAIERVIARLEGLRATLRRE